MARPITSAILRLWSHVDKNGPVMPGMTTPCWVFTGADNGKGYGVISRGGRGNGLQYVHIVAWEDVNGLVPDGRELDHLCRLRACCRPDHLEAVTSVVNNARSNSLSALNKRKTHCMKGHPFDTSNTYEFRGVRICRTCRRERMAEWRSNRAETEAR